MYVEWSQRVLRLLRTGYREIAQYFTTILLEHSFPFSHTAISSNLMSDDEKEMSFPFECITSLVYALYARDEWGIHIAISLIVWYEDNCILLFENLSSYCHCGELLNDIKLTVGLSFLVVRLFWRTVLIVFMTWWIWRKSMYVCTLIYVIKPLLFWFDRSVGTLYWHFFHNLAIEN